jgi:hypothetical protein
MTMTSKDYKKIAADIKIAFQKSYGAEDLKAANEEAFETLYLNVAYNLAGTFEKDNPGFQKAAFLKACGV